MVALDANAQFYTLTDLGSLVSASYSVPHSLNENSDVVGYSQVSSGKYHAFIWAEAIGMLVLNTLTYGMDDWVLEAGLGINDRGQIVGLGKNAKGALPCGPADATLNRCALDPIALTVPGANPTPNCPIAWRRTPGTCGPINRARKTTPRDRYK